MKEIKQFIYKKLDSTNTWAKNNLKDLQKDQLVCVVAKEQTKGRGRANRSWLSPVGNIYCTFCFTLPKDTANLPSLGLVLAYSCSSILQSHKLTPQIKWPNDILVSGKKMGGILCETVFEKQQVRLYLSIGVNINMELSALQSIDIPATSVNVELGKQQNVEHYYKELRDQFSKNLTTFTEKNFTPFRDPIQQLLAFKGKEIWLQDEIHTKKYKAICHSISPEGRLNIELENGEIKTIFSGEIVSTAH